MSTLSAAIHATVYRGGGDPSLIFDLPLLTNIIPGKAIDSTPTFTRATAATFIDHEGIVRWVPSGCARFQGARMVRNVCKQSNDITRGIVQSSGTSSYWGPSGSAVATSETSFTITSGADGWIHSSKTNTFLPTVSGRTIVVSFECKYEGTSGAINVTGNDGAAWSTINENVLVPITSEYQRYAVKLTYKTTAVGTTIRAMFGAVKNDGTAAAGVVYGTYHLRNVQIEETSGASDDTAPSEFLATGTPNGTELVTDNWTDEASAGHVITNGGRDILCKRATSDVFLTLNVALTAGKTYRISYEVESNTAAVPANGFYFSSTGQLLDAINASAIVRKYSQLWVADSSLVAVRFTLTSSQDNTEVQIRNFSIQEIVQQSPYEVGAENIKFFTTTNGNTVDANYVVTEAAGSAISDSTLNGLLHETTRTNVYLNSEEIGTSFSKVRSTVTANQGTAPNGVLAADKLAETVDANTHYIYQTTSFTPTASTPYAFSAFVKAVERTKCRVQFYSTNAVWNSEYIEFDLSAGSVIGTSGTLAGYNIEPLADSWYRIWVACTTQATPTGGGNLGLQLLDASGASSYTGDGSSGILVWGAQLEQGISATSYIPTTSAAVQRNLDFLSYSKNNIDPTIGSIDLDVWVQNAVGSLNHGILNTRNSSSGLIAFGYSYDELKSYDEVNSCTTVRSSNVYNYDNDVRSAWSAAIPEMRNATRINGGSVLTQSSAFDGSFRWDYGLTFGLGREGSDAAGPMCFKGLRIWNQHKGQPWVEAL